MERLRRLVNGFRGSESKNKEAESKNKEAESNPTRFKNRNLRHPALQHESLGVSTRRGGCPDGHGRDKKTKFSRVGGATRRAFSRGRRGRVCGAPNGGGGKGGRRGGAAGGGGPLRPATR